MGHYTARNPVTGNVETKISARPFGMAVFAVSPALYRDNCYLYGWTRDENTAARMAAEARKHNAATETWIVPTTKHV